MSVTDRLSARLAKYSQQNNYGSALRMTSLAAPPRIPQYHKVQDQLSQVPHTTSSILSSVGGSTLANGSTMPAHLNPSIQVLSNQVIEGGNAVNEVNRELAQTRSRLYTQERQLANFETQLRQKDDAMRKVIQESAGEKNALVEALQEARNKADGLQIELGHKAELLEKAEYQLSSFKEEFVQLQEKYIRQSKELGELKHGQQHYKDSQNIQEVKNNILTQENDKLTAQVEELQNVELENKVLKQNLAQLEHEFASVSAKYEKETKSSTDLKAALTTLKQEYSEVLRKFADSQDDYNNVKQLKLKYEELCKQHSDVSESFRNLSDKYAELDARAHRDEESLSLERQAVSALAQIFTDLIQINHGAPDPSAGDLEKLNSKLHNVQLSTSYQKLLPIISKVRATISLSHANSGQLKTIEQAHQTSQKDLATATAKISELQLQLDAAETSNARLKESLDTRDSELQQRLVSTQRTEQDLQKAQLAIKLQLGQLQSILQQATAATTQITSSAQTTSTSPGTIPALPSNVIASIQTASKIKPDVDNIQEITAAILSLHNTRAQQLEQLAMQCQRLDTEITTLQVANEQQINSIKTLEDQNIRLKQQINGHETRQVQDSQQISQFKAQQANLAQFIQVLLQNTNQNDLRVNKLIQQSGISNQIISNYLSEQHLINVQSQSKAQSARSKLLKVYYAGVFMFKLKKYGKWYREQLDSQPKAFKERTNDQADNLLNQCNQMVAPIVHQTGDIKSGLIMLQQKEQRELINRVLSNFLQSGSTVHYFTGAPVNARTGQFRFFSECFNKVTRDEKLSRDKMQLQVNELNKQNAVLQITVNEQKKEIDSITQSGRQKDQDIIRLKQGIESYYIEKREYDTLAYAKKDLEQKLQLISEQSQDKTRQITSMEVDIQTFQNEITRLNDQLQQNDKLVKNLTNKYDSQISSQEQLKDLVLNYEGQLKQKQNRIEELEMKSAEDRLSKQTIQKTLDNNIQQMSDLRTQLEQRDKLITDLQLQIEKENRLRVISEHQLIKEKERQGGAYKEYLPASASQSLVPSAIPTSVNILKPQVPKMQPTTYDNQSNIKNLINQLNNLD